MKNFIWIKVKNVLRLNENLFKIKPLQRTPSSGSKPERHLQIWDPSKFSQIAKSPHIPNVSHSLTSSHSRWLLQKFKKLKKIYFTVVSKFRLFWSILNLDFPEQRCNHCYIHIDSLRPYFCIHFFPNTHRFPNRTHRYLCSYRAHFCFQSVRHFVVKLHPLQSLVSMSIRMNRRDLYRSNSHRNYEFLKNIVNANTLYE